MTTPIQYETRIEIYPNERTMKAGVKRMQKQGWQVENVTTIEQGGSAGKPCCLGVLFLPLALLGRQPIKDRVEFRRPK